MKKPRVLFITVAGGIYGIGHLMRCRAIAEVIEHKADSYFYITHRSNHGGLFDSDFNQSLDRVLGKFHLLSKLNELSNVDCIVTDMRDTTPGEMKQYSSIAPVVSIDDSGKGARYALIRISTLSSAKTEPANYDGLQYLVLSPLITRLSKKIDKEKKGILVSFGGSDPYDCTGTIVKVLNELGIRPKVIRGPFYKKSFETYDAEIISSPNNILSLINNAQILITSYGITLFEGIYLETGVILYNHTKYHMTISKSLPIPNLGYQGGVSHSQLLKRLSKLLGDGWDRISPPAEIVSQIDGRGAERIGKIVLSSINSQRSHCLFHHHRSYALLRRENYTIARCDRCGDVFLCNLSSRKKNYGTNYFCDEYERQYGRSYIKDRINIEKLGKARLDVIEKIQPGKGRILDVGCALGFFVALASARGWNAEGVEVSQFASSWARENLHITIHTGSFLDIQLPEESYNAITFFFVAEHFPEVEKAIEKAKKLLVHGGVLAMALPNRKGISFRINREDWLRNHPLDHFFDTTPRNLGRFLASYGFVTSTVRITGIHPERFFRRVGFKKSIPIIEKIYNIGARFARLGDTFELYSIKDSE